MGGKSHLAKACEYNLGEEMESSETLRNNYEALISAFQQVDDKELFIKELAFWMKQENVQVFEMAMEIRYPVSSSSGLDDVYCSELDEEYEAERNR